MTKEEYFNLAENKPGMTDDSIYKLTIRTVRSDTKGYRKSPDVEEWSYRIFNFSTYYSSRENAVKAFIDYLPKNKCIHSALIERLAINLPVDDSDNLEWWTYDRNGNEVDKSFCTSRFDEKPTIHDVYFGRRPEQIPFEIGEIVEIVNGDRVYLQVLNGIPPTLDKMWELYDNRVKKWGEPESGSFSTDYFADPMAEQYFYLRPDGFDPDVPPFFVMKPVFSIPKKAKEILTGRYNRWKTYVDTHEENEIDRSELEKAVKG